MLKKLLLFALFFLLIYPISAFAQSQSLISTPGGLISPSIEKKPAKVDLDAFKQRVALIKDARKKVVVEKIVDKIASSNAKLTTKMSGALTKLSSNLSTIKNNEAGLKTKGKNTASLDLAIASAEAAISQAESAVETQSQKQYSANISNDTTLKNTIGQMVSGFRLDLTATFKLVVSAKQAVSKVIEEFATLGGASDIKSNIIQ